MALVLLPAVVLGLLGRNIRHYGLLASLVILYLVFGQSREQAAYLVVFYLVNLHLVKVYPRLKKRYQGRWLIWTVVIVSLLPLVASKAWAVFSPVSLGFLGLSYVSFRAVQILLEIHDGLIEDVTWFEFSYFILFFPTLSSGPIDRYRRFMQDLYKKQSGREYLHTLGEGINKLLIGVGYKFVIGYCLDTYWMSKIPVHHHTLLNTVNYMYAYSFYLFFDFAGYSLIAIGASYILGIITPENFNRPFISRDFKDFWMRWHMSLSFWFRDFIYTRFVMTALRKKWFKSKYTASYLGYFLTFGLMGLWHGTQVFYLVYGLYHGTLIVLTDFYQRKSSLYKRYKDHWLLISASVLVTFHLICFGFLIFSGYLFK
jgi:membrane protein involved in D-alanine export